MTWRMRSRGARGHRGDGPWWGRDMPKHWRAIVRDIFRQYPKATFHERIHHYQRVTQVWSLFAVAYALENA